MSNKGEIFSTEKLLEVLRLSLQEGWSQRKIGKHYGVAKSTIGYFLRKETYKDFWEDYDKKPHLSGSVKNPLEQRKKVSGKRFVITSAQNNTYVHDKFFKSLLTYCEENKAELLVSTFVYDKNGFQSAGKNPDKREKQYWYDPKIEPYRCDESLQLAEGLVFCGELNILPTDINPLGGFYNYLAEQSGIIPHAKIQMESLPAPKHKSARMMYTTGALTTRNYIQKKTGQKASWHHCFGAVVVEIDDEGDWFVRQLHAEQDTGEFFDFTKKYTPNGVEDYGYIEAVNYGDVHAAKLDDTVAESSWGKVFESHDYKGSNSILDTLKPKYQLIHDVLDQRARNHHSVKDPHFLFEMFHAGTESVKAEVEQTAEVLRSMKRPFSKVVVVESNHDLALEKWLKEQDYRKDPVNAEFFLELQLDKYKAISNRDSNFSTFENAVLRVAPDLDDIKFLRTDESFEVVGIECGQHGHNGAGGARGNVSQFRRMGVKFNIGHSHAAGIKDAVYQSGVSGKLDMGYNVGGSAWSHSHILTYPNGKRAIVTLKNGKWRV